jgi:hypothetical protein
MNRFYFLKKEGYGMTCFLSRLFLVLGMILTFMVSPASAQNPLPAESSEKATETFLNTGVLRFGIHTSGIGNFDPDYAKGSEDYTYADMVFNSLLRYVPGDSSRLEPDIAVKIPEFEIKNGKQIWTIQLRRGYFFPWGTLYPPL